MSTLPPLPVGDVSVYFEGQRIGKAHSADQMRVYATAALSAQATEVEALRAALAELVRTRELLRDCHSSQGAIPLGELAALLNAAWDAARAALKERAPNGLVTGCRRQSG